MLLGITIQEFLTSTLPYTLPHMILGKRVDIIESLLEAYNSHKKGPPESVFQMCMRHIPSVLGFLLVQFHQHAEQAVILVLRNIDDTFERIDLVELIKADPINIMAETLRAYSDLDTNNKKDVCGLHGLFQSIKCAH